MRASPNGVEYLDVEEARERSGVRLVLTMGVPGPWGEAAKGLLHVKGIPFVRVAQDPGVPNEALREWTGITNAPQIVYDDEEPIHAWADFIFFAERVKPEPALIPADAGERALMFGLIREIAGEQGLGWCRRLTLFHPLLSNPDARENPALEVVVRMGHRYHYSPEAAEAAPERISEILGLLAERLASQRAAGARYFIGGQLTALDIYWSAFAAILAPLPPELCAMQDFMRQQYTATDPGMLEALDPALLEHRDLVYREHLELPVPPQSTRPRLLGRPPPATGFRMHAALPPERRVRTTPTPWRGPRQRGTERTSRRSLRASRTWRHKWLRRSSGRDRADVLEGALPAT